jgi:pyroglutamyl-peptidase
MNSPDPVGLLIGSAPFAGLPDSPSQDLLTQFDGQMIAGATIRAVEAPVSFSRLPCLIEHWVTTHRPAFVVSMGLLAGEAVFHLETTAINRVDFGVADNEGNLPASGTSIDPDGPGARFATWDSTALERTLLAHDLPAVTSHHAGTHLCNLVLYCAIGAMERAGLSGPTGFLHLPYSSAQVARFLRDRPEKGDTAPMTPRAVPNLPMAMQVEALRLTLQTVARQAERSGA